MTRFVGILAQMPLHSPRLCTFIERMVMSWIIGVGIWIVLTWLFALGELMVITFHWDSDQGQDWNRDWACTDMVGIG